MSKDKVSALSGTEKLEKICKTFPLLSEEKQDYILGILQALAFAHNASAPQPHGEEKAPGEP